MVYEWDENKYISNLSKHGIRFEDAQYIFSDSNALVISDFESGEERYVIIGLNPFKGVLTVVYCERSTDTIRIISARKATQNERVQYEKRI